MYHDGHWELQDRFDGRRLANALEKHRRLEVFGEEEIRFIEAAEFFFLATAYGKSVDCSFKGGPPGFVKVTGPTVLEWDDFDGNSMYRSLGNMVKSPHAGLLFIRFGSAPKRLRVNGTCELSDRQTPEGPKLTIRLQADEIFPNCPRYIPDLSKVAASPYLPDENGAGAKPNWKDAEDLKSSLPKNDPHRG
jgi:hypothetical protein